MSSDDNTVNSQWRATPSYTSDNQAVLYHDERRTACMPCSRQPSLCHTALPYCHWSDTNNLYTNDNILYLQVKLHQQTNANHTLLFTCATMIWSSRSKHVTRSGAKEVHATALQESKNQPATDRKYHCGYPRLNSLRTTKQAIAEFNTKLHSMLCYALDWLSRWKLVWIAMLNWADWWL